MPETYGPDYYAEPWDWFYSKNSDSQIARDVCMYQKALQLQVHVPEGMTTSATCTRRYHLSYMYQKASWLQLHAPEALQLNACNFVRTFHNSMASATWNGKSSVAWACSQGHQEPFRSYRAQIQVLLGHSPHRKQEYRCSLPIQNLQVHLGRSCLVQILFLRFQLWQIALVPACLTELLSTRYFCAAVP